MEILAVVGFITVTAAGVAIRHVGRSVALRDLAMVARATRSPRACVGFIRFCA